MSYITILVTKDELLTVLRENREKHRGLFEKAWDGYCTLTRAELEEKLARIKKGKSIDCFFRNQPPDDHTDDYDDVIDMLTMATDEKIELTQPQFKQYVKDDWGWSQTWTSSNTAYIAASS